MKVLGFKTISVLLLILTILFLAVFKKPYNQADLEKSVSQSLVDCYQEELDRMDSGCFAEKATHLVRLYPVSKVVASLEDLFRNSPDQYPYGQGSCHSLTHMLGEKAIENGDSFSQVARSCGNLCNSGCTHGAFVAYAQEKGGIFNNFDKLCGELSEGQVAQDKTSCYHMLGHSLTETLSGDLSAAFGYCDQVKENQPRHICGDGVIMEKLMGRDWAEENKNITSNADLLEFCRGVPDNFQSTCYGTVGSYSYYYFQGTSEATTICDQVQEEWRGSCVASMAGMAYYDYRLSAEKANEFCSQFEEYSPDCLIGMIENDLGKNPEGPFSLNRCRALSEASKQSYCYGYLGATAENYHGQQAREKICSFVPWSEQATCLSQPRNR